MLIVTIMCVETYENAIVEQDHWAFTVILNKMKNRLNPQGKVMWHICGRNTISILWATLSYCVFLIGEDLMHYSNKTESVALRKWCQNKKHFAELAQQNDGKTSGIDMIWRNYVTVPMYTEFIENS